MLALLLRLPGARFARASRRAAPLAGALAVVLACNEDKTTTGPDFKGGNAAPLTASPAELEFTIPPATPASLMASVQYTTIITAHSSDEACATVSPLSIPAVKPEGSSVYIATFTVTPVGVGSCTITLTDKKGEQVQVPVEVTAAPVVTQPVTLGVGAFHTCGLTVQGGVYCWGNNVFGQLGDGTTTDHPTPTPVTGPGSGPALSFASLAVAYTHTCALTSDGTAYCWGLNSSSQLGDGGTTNQAAPIAVIGPGGGPALAFASLTGGGDHTCGLTSAGLAYCWGQNAYGQLGDGTTTGRTAPTAVTGPGGGAALTFTRLVAGLFHTCGLITGGTAYCWGRNEFGSLGDGTTTNQTSPVAVTGGLSFTSLTGGGNETGDHTCGVTTAGAAYCWGFNDEGQIGDGSITNQTVPAAVAGGLTFASLAAGSRQSCGRMSSGAAYYWGLNFGGDGTFGGNKLSPAAVAPPTGSSSPLSFTSLTTGGGGHTCGLTSDGAAYCWGSNDVGQVGDGTTSTTNQLVPIAVTGGLTFATP